MRRQDIYDVYLSVNTLHRLGGCRPLSEDASRRRDHIPLPRRARRRRNYVTGQTMDWDEIPLSHEMDTLQLPIDGAPTATGMGNPHCTFFVDDADAIDLAARGSEMEHHPLYPQRTNVQFASVIGSNHLRMRVWERGVGVTLASGSSTCATAVAAARRGLTDRKVRVDLDGGTLFIDWRDDGVWMTGPTMHVSTGVLTPEFIAAHR